MSRVNPPPHLRIPRKFFDDAETRPYFQQLEFMMFQLWARTGGGNDAVESANEYNAKNLAAVNEIRERLGSGDALTWDETGFTWDSDRLSFDMDEA
jgi:hypothetical protein